MRKKLLHGNVGVYVFQVKIKDGPDFVRKIKETAFYKL